jgi:uncharacterized membrane protein YdbT with pleckstrin-like domain
MEDLSRRRLAMLLGLGALAVTTGGAALTASVVEAEEAKKKATKKKKAKAKTKTKSKQPAEAEGETQLAQADETPPNN